MKMFSKVRGKNDIKEIFSEYYDETSNKYFPDIIEAGLSSLTNLDEQKENTLVILGKSIDSYYRNDPSNYQYEIADKINTIMTSAIFLDKFYDETIGLNDKEFLSLALFCSSQVPDFIESYINIYNKNVLNLICSKFDNYDDREKVLQVTNYNLDDEKIKDEEAIIQFISSIDKEDVNDLYIEYGNNLAQDMHDMGVII